jgi:bacterial/archaeal transporter family-2 protein
MTLIVIAAVLVGANTVLCRYLNSLYAKYNGLSMGTLANYVTGLVTSLIVLLILGDPASVLPVGSLTLRKGMMFLGGAFGVGMIQLFIYVTPRMPAVQSTILIFASQLGFGLVLDALLSGAFSLGRLLGVLMVLLGLGHYVWVNAGPAEKKKTAL